jgi:2-polyprenyl-6-methoxyphenol hydroxylase-like FAD-dependent oxidoreductase
MNLNVLVVGAGPVGLTMAAELARYGVSVRIVDKAAQRTDKSKALVLWSRSLELIDRMGCGETFVAAGLKVTAANIIAGGRLVAHIRLDTMETPHPYALMLPQSETERLMEQHLNSCDVQVERQVELTRFVADADKVTSTLLHPDGHEETVPSAWMIGCDGAHSAVRHGLGMQFEGDTLPSDWILADVHLAGVSTKPDEFGMFWHSEGVLALFPITPGRYRVIADVGDAHSKAPRPDPSLEEVQAIIDQRGPGGILASTPIWLASFRINERKVADYRAGRVFLAGDAAHIHSPAGGQGMNTGMQDACNLGWKLALVCRGLAAAEPLLDSYSTERSAVGRQVLADAGRLTTIAVLRSGVMQAVRNHVASLVFGLAPVCETMANKLAELSIGYPESPLTRQSRHSHAGPAPGQRAPILDTAHPVGAGDTPRFALFAQSDSEGAALIARHGDLLEPQIRPPFAEGNIWLVRPDGYVALVAGHGAWGDVEDYLGHVVGGANGSAVPRAMS